MASNIPSVEKGFKSVLRSKFFSELESMSKPSAIQRMSMPYIVSSTPVANFDSVENYEVESDIGSIGANPVTLEGLEKKFLNLDLSNFAVEELQKLRRKWAVICHPDRMPETQRAEAHQIMSAINQRIDEKLLSGAPKKGS